jgi:hypothetical protein
MTAHTFEVVSHEWWDCAGCGGQHFSEGCAWVCMRCGEYGDGFNKFLTKLAGAGLDPERVDGEAA